MDAGFMLRAERVFDGERLVPGGAAVFVEGGRITAVEPITAVVPPGWQLAERAGATLLPGLIDAHVHLCGDSRNGALDRLADHSDGEQAEVIEAGLRRQLAAGVTAVRDLGDRCFATLAWRRRPGLPEVVVSGPPITIPRGHCWNMGGEVSGVEQIRAAIAERSGRGVDVVKVMASGGVNTEGTDVLACQFSDDELRLLVTLAHDAGLPITAHAHALPAVEQAIKVGVDGIEHCSCLTSEGVRISAALLGQLATRHIVVCPTLGAVPGATPPARVQAMFERLRLTPGARAGHAAQMYDAGVTIISGGDSGIGAGKPHGLLPWAVIELASAGVPAQAALASATSQAADACGFGDRKGRIRPGFDADLLLVDGDPLTDPHALTRPHTVVVRGHANGPG